MTASVSPEVIEKLLLSIEWWAVLDGSNEARVSGVLHGVSIQMKFKEIERIGKKNSVTPRIIMGG